MPRTDETVRARIDGAVKAQATEIFDQMGITMSGAIRMLLAHVVAERALPFEVRAPNPVTRKAIEASRSGKVVTFSDVDTLLSDLETNED